MGVYKRLDEVPDHRRLQRHAEAYADRDVWATFLSEYLFERFDSDRFKEDARRAGRYWKEHMAERGRHHALARPADVETWMADLTDRLKLKTAYNQYWVRLERFYWWLQRHTDHPHSYQPVLMAAAEGGAAGDVWTEKLARRDGSTNR
jgi:hypothetical protein